MSIGSSNSNDLAVGTYRLFGSGDQSRWNAIEQWFASGGSLADLARLSTDFPSGGWGDFPLRHVMSADGVTLTPSVVEKRGVVTSAGGAGNHREVFLNPDFATRDSEIRSVIYGGGTWADSANRTQQGHVHRAQVLPDGTCRHYIAWHDMVTGIPTGINVGVWEGNGTTFTLRFSNVVLGVTPRPPFMVISASRTANVVELVIPGGQSNGIRVGDRVDVHLSSAGLNANGATVTLVFGDVVRFNLPGPDVAAADGGIGFLTRSRPLENFPYWLASRLEGRTISAKIWRIGEAEPPWSAGATHSDAPGATSPTAPIDVGFPGVMVGHVEGGQSVEFGRIWLAGR
jgi:hypothetical protein